MISNKILFITIVIGLSCTPNKEKWTLPGEYKSKTYSLLEKIILQANNKTYILHSRIILNKDSSYVFETCGSVMKGKWTIEYDSLILKCEQNRYVNDSINNIRQPSCGEEPIKFFIDYDRKELKEIIDNNGKVIQNYFTKDFN